MAKALKTAHSQHIVHRDIKPQNILITDEGKIKVADFGIARLVTDQTLNANAIGSVHYISPEQARGGRCDARSDIYSLGITMYEMLTGRVPFTGESTVAIALAHLEQAMTPPSVYNNRISHNLERIILKCTKKDPARRYQDVDSLLYDLENALLNPDEKFVDSGATKVIRGEEVAVLSSTKVAYDDVDEDSEEDDAHDEKMDKIMSIVGIVIAVIIILVLVFFVGRFTGVFGGKKTETTQSTLDSKQTVMPGVVGLSEEMAEKKLSDSNLQMQVLGSEYSENVEKGNVISQDPKEGEVVSKYSKVSVVVSLGSESVDIGKLGIVGKTKESADAILKENGFSVEYKEENSDTYEKGTVISYSPLKPKRGEKIVLNVSSGKKVTKAVVPSIGNMTEDAAKALLESSGYKVFEAGKSYKPGDKIYKVNRNKSILASTIGSEPIAKGLRINGAHIDSPRLDLRPNPLYEKSEISYFKTHYYGGIRKYQWATIPLSMHGVIFRKDGSFVEINLGEAEDDPVFYISDLLPHLSQKQDQRKLSEGIKGEELNIFLGTLPFDDTDDVKEAVKLKTLEILNNMYGVTERDFARAEIEFVPATKARDVGFDRSLLAGYGHDDRVCA